MLTATCLECKRELTQGESAWARDWKVLDPSTGSLRTEIRYTCDDCEANQ